MGFKPCYKWNTFNTLIEYMINIQTNSVLNLVINGIPSTPRSDVYENGKNVWVLNLVINGIPSTPLDRLSKIKFDIVLNLVINGIPSTPNVRYS